MIWGTNQRKHMVERPIKKSERPAKDTTNDSGDSSTMQPSERDRDDRSTRNKDRDKDRGRGRGGKGSRSEEPRSAGNPALMRGPKPVKAKPPVEAVEEPTINSETDLAADSQESTPESEAAPIE
jgi:hypothetical protein